MNIEKKLIKIFLAFGIAMFSYLFLFSIVFSYQNTIFTTQDVYKVVESVPKNILGLIICSGIIFGLAKLLSMIKVKSAKGLAIGVGIICAIIAIYWIFTCGALPGADAYSICVYASQINAGDYSSFNAGEYIGMWRQQLGIITFLRFIFKIFGDGNYQVFRILSALSIILLVYSGYKIVNILSKENRFAECLYLVLSIFCLPIYFYTAHVYGEMISTAFLLYVFWQMLEIMNKWEAKKLVFIFIGMFIAYTFRQNSLIAVIAMAGILVVKSILNRDIKLLAIIAVLLIGCFSESFIMHVAYDKYFPENSEPMPSVLWITMGLNEANDQAGWWNRESVYIFEDCGFDAQAASEAGKALIKERLKMFVSDPVHLIRFYVKKVSSQWIAPMWQSIAMSNVIDEGKESSLAHALYYDERVSTTVAWIMNVYQIFVYGLALVWLLYCFKNPGVLQNYVIPITAFGGMLFSILWEAKTRYMFPYYLMILVMAGIGAGILYCAILEKIKSKGSGESGDK